MENKNLVVYGIFKSRENLETAVAHLRDDGFLAADISVLFPSSDTTHEFAHEKDTKAPEGTTLGGAAGAALGGTLGWLAGIGTLAIPGVGPLIAAGPIMAALAGAGAGGLVGGVVGALVGMGIPEYEAKRYAGRVHDGGILMSIHCDNNDWRNKACAILESTGAEDISKSSEASADKNIESRPQLHA